MKTIKMSERKELEEELKVAKRQIEENEARLNGTNSPTMKRNLLKIDDEISQIKDIVRLREIEIEDYQPSEQTKHLRQEWHDLNKKFMNVQLEEARSKLKIVQTMKDKIVEDMPRLKERVKEIEDKLNLKQEKADYVG